MNNIGTINSETERLLRKGTINDATKVYENYVKQSII